MANRAFVIIDYISGSPSGDSMQASGNIRFVGENPDPIPGHSGDIRVSSATISGNSSWAQVVNAVAQAVVAVYAAAGLVIQERDVSVSDFR